MNSNFHVPGWIGITLNVISWTLSVLIIIAHTPPLYKVWKTKQTSGISRWSWIGASACAAVWILYGTLLGVSELIPVYEGQKIDPNLVASGFAVAIFDIYALVTSLYVLFVKQKNMKEAAKLGISEEEYCKKIAKK